jgi:hypothetical protein
VPGFSRAGDTEKPPLRSQPPPLAIDAPHIPTPDWVARDAELLHWVDDYSEWREWALRWGNRREPGWFSRSRDRRKRPDPPAWLPAECDVAVEPNTALAEGCRLLDEWAAGYPVRQPVAGTLTSTSASEEPEKTIWWEHVHLDGGWPALQSGSGVFGVIGMHATTSVRGRLQIFVAPGAMLLNVPTRGGGRAWKVATNYGIAYRLGELTFPGKRRALLHLNLAKVWLLGAGPDIANRSTDLIGLSITFNRTR